MAKLSDSKVFYLQAVTILALVCLPGNIFTAVMLYIQHFSSSNLPTAENNVTVLPESNNTVLTNSSFEISTEYVVENDQLFGGNVESVGNVSSKLFLLKEDTDENKTDGQIEMSKPKNGQLYFSLCPFLLKS